MADPYANLESAFLPSSALGSAAPVKVAVDPYAGVDKAFLPSTALSRVPAAPIEAAEVTTGQSALGGASSFLAGTGQGMAMQGGDEAVAAIRALGPTVENVLEGEPAAYGKNYSDKLDSTRQVFDAIRDYAPAPYVAGEAVGTTADMLSGAGEALAPIRGAGLLNNAANLAGGGAAIGAVTGFNSGRGGAAPRLEEATKEGGLGALFAPTAGALGAGAQAVKGAVAPMFESAEDSATRFLSRAFTRDGVAPSDIPANLQTLGPGARVIDAGKANVLGTGRAVAGTPGNGKTALIDTLSERNANMQDSVAGLVNKDLGDSQIYGKLDELGKKRLADSVPLYQKAYADPPIRLEDLSPQLTQAPAFQSSLRHAVEIARNDPEFTGPPIEKYIGTGPDGQMVVKEALPMQIVQYVQRGAAKTVDNARNAVTGKLDDAGGAIDRWRKGLLQEVDGLRPNFAAARAAYAGPSQSMGAIQAGQEFSGQQPEEITAALQKFLPADQKLAQAGHAREIMQKLQSGRDVANPAKRITGSTADRARIEAAHPETGTDFNTKVGNLSQLFDNGQAVLTGSRTAPMGAEMKELQADPQALMEAVVNPRATAVRLGTRGLGKLFNPDAGERRAAALAPLLIENDPGKIADLVQMLTPQVRTGKYYPGASRVGPADVPFNAKSTPNPVSRP